MHKSVLVTGQDSALATANGQTILRTSVRLLIRCTPNLVVAVNDSRLRHEVGRLLDDGRAGGSIVAATDVDRDRFDAVLSIGPQPESHPETIAVWSDGWCAHVSSTALDSESAATNAVGAVAAASLGAGEIFKKLIKLRPARGRAVDRLVFSLYDYKTTGNRGPDMRNVELGSLLQAGAGAIGNGVALTLIESDARGAVTIVDGQTFGDENWGTCVLMSANDTAKPKAMVLSDQLTATNRFTTEWRQSLLEDYTGPVPGVVISALDSPEARRSLQLMWPEIVIDGAIGDFPCEVGVHPWEGEIACLRCWYPVPAGSSADQIQAEATGLAYRRLANPDSDIMLEDVELAPIAKRDWLRARIGKPVCSVVAEAVAAFMSTSTVAHGFEPSVPFVACFSAAMVVGELLKYSSGQQSVLEPRFQFDFMRGPKYGLMLPMTRTSSCVCVGRRDQIESLRVERKRN